MTFIFNILQSVIDFFYPPFRRFMTIQFFRYGTVGSLNLVLDWILYFLIYNVLLHQKMMHLGFVTLSSHIAALVIKLPFVLMLGFLMQRFITFSNSTVPPKTQLFRYLLVAAVNLGISYFGLKLLVDYFTFYPTPSNMIITIASVAFSYFSQRNFTFKVN